jgi:hypothetical protein
MPPSRRSVLGSIGASGTAALGLTSVSGVAAAIQNNDLEVEELSGAARDRILERVSEQREVKQLRRHVEQQLSLNTQTSGSIVTKTTASDVTGLTAVIPFASRDSDQESDVVLRWSSSDKIETVIFDLRTGGQTTIYSTSQDDIGALSISTEVHQHGRRETSSSDCACECKRTSCSSFNWKCVVGTASSIGLAITVCGACVARPGRETCGVCLFSVGQLANISCDVGEDCSTETLCIEREARCTDHACES